MKNLQKGVIFTGVLLLAACGDGSHDAFQGYAEGEYVRVAAPFAGNLQQLNVGRGNTVQPGTPLFTLEQENEAAGQREAVHNQRNAEAQLEQARASLKLSQITLQRQQELAASRFVSQNAVDDARTNYERDKAHVAQLAAQVGAMRAALAQADWALAQKSVTAPVAGLVNDTNYVVGEWVPAGSPVVSLLPPQNIKVRFFVPEPALGSIHVDEPVHLICDGCGAPIAGRVTFISPQAEFTPPVIYSRENRSKLVYLLEARPAPADAVKLHPGQPVDVRLGP